MKQEHRLKSYAIVALVILFVIILIKFFPKLDFLTSPTLLRTYIQSFGNWSYFIFVGLLLLSIPFPIPSTPIVLAGGYVFGTVFGSMLALVACALGSSIAFLLIRKFGRPLLEKLVDSHHITHLEKINSHRGHGAIFLSYAIPLFPSDAVSLCLGLTKMKYRHFLLILVLGHIPRYLILNSLGNDLFVGFSWHTAIVIACAIVFVVIWMFSHEIKMFLFKEIRELKQL